MPVAILNKVWPILARGGTVQFAATFYDANGNVTVPPSAQVNIAFTASSGSPTSVLIAMAQAFGGQPFIAQWDSRGAAPGIVCWSVETPGSPPVSVEDGQFTLEANAANQVTF
jgi:hypothetical protein